MKRKLPKRLFPRKMASDFINTDRFDHNKAAAYNAQRSKTTTGRGNTTEHNPETNFLEPVPETVLIPIASQREAHLARVSRIVGMDKADLIDLLTSWQSDRFQGVSRYHCQVIEEREGYVLKRYFSGNKFIFVAETPNTRFISRIYTGLNVAIHVHRNKIIRWVVDLPISTSG